MKITYFNKKEVVCTNKVCSIVGVDIIRNVKIANVMLESMYSTFFWLRSRIQSSQSSYTLILFDNSKKK